MKQNSCCKTKQIEISNHFYANLAAVNKTKDEFVQDTQNATLEKGVGGKKFL